MKTSKWYEFVDGVNARVNEIIEETKDLAPSWEGLAIYKKVMACGQYNTEGVVGLGEAEVFAEGGRIKYDEMYPAYRTEYTTSQRGKATTITQKMMFAQTNEFSDQIDKVRSLRYSVNRNLTQNFWAILNDGFGTTDSSANRPINRLGDGVAMFSASHPSLVPGVAVRSNIISGTGSGVYSGVNPTMNETSLFEAIAQLGETKNGRGDQINYDGGIVLVVPKRLEKLAKEITLSTKRSDTSNNDMNYYTGGTVDIISTNYLGAANSGSDTAWYVMASPGAAENAVGIRYVECISPKIEAEKDFDTKSMKISVDADAGFGYSNWEYMLASTGLEA